MGWALAFRSGVGDIDHTAAHSAARARLAARISNSLLRDGGFDIVSVTPQQAEIAATRFAGSAEAAIGGTEYRPTAPPTRSP
jgi:hypothetical protein